MSPAQTRYSITPARRGDESRGAPVTARWPRARNRHARFDPTTSDQRFVDDARRRGSDDPRDERLQSEGRNGSVKTGWAGTHESTVPPDPEVELPVTPLCRFVIPCRY